MRPPLSIVLAAHNAADSIRVLLESLCSAGEKDIEICICDDASTDKTRAVIESFRGRLRILLAVNEQNEGVSRARNRALSLASGELLLFLDADVRLYSDTIFRLRKSLSRSEADILEGIYSPVALDPGLVSAYYAVFIHHSFLVAREPVPYNVFNAWCALCRREVMDAVGGFSPVANGVEIENELMGRRITARGFKLFLDPAIAVDHGWGGLPKIFFIFTRRVYWWVKTFFATRLRFERCLTTWSYGLATPAFPLACGLFFAALWTRTPILARGLAMAGALLSAAFLAAYASFYRFAYRYKGFAFAAICAALSAFFSFVITASAVYSFGEELAKITVTGRPSLDPRLFQT